MTSTKLADVVRCPDCRGQVLLTDRGACCRTCGRTFDRSRGFLDLRPRETFAEQTKYLDDSLHADDRHASVAPPLLGSRVRNDMLKRFLQLRPGDRVLDLGCGSGRAMIWNADSGAALTGIDISAHFASEALARCDLILGDLRRLPLADASFDKAWSLDVFEHLSAAALREVLAEENRVLAPGGLLFVYTHVRKNGPIAGGVRAVNRLASALERAGLLDLRQERLRKSDHVNPLADHPELRQVLADAGFSVERLTFYTPIVGSVAENIVTRLGERWLVRQTVKRGVSQAAAPRAVRTEAQARMQRRGAAYWAARLMTFAMKLDVVLFGRLESGPFFALLRKTPQTPLQNSRPSV
jgi:SAM-dependent methyltransferase